MRSQRLRGIASMLLAVGFFALMDTFLKLFSAHYPAIEVSALRGAASVPFVVLSVALTGRLRTLKPVRWRLHFLRGVLAIVMLTTFIYSVRILPLADAYSVFMAAPLMVTALSVPFLREQVDAKRWVAIGIGMLGMLIVLRPSAASLATLGAMAAFVAAICYALAAISVRVLTRTDTTAAMVFWFMLSLTVFGGILAAPDWVPLRREHWPWLVAVGIFGALGQHFLTEAFRHAPASVVAPFEYTAMLWAIAIDWVIWQHAPSLTMLVGGSIITGCGLFLILLERRAQSVAVVESAHT
jgi:drug/metabolite transporter (DMT)-like permease